MNTKGNQRYNETKNKIKGTFLNLVKEKEVKLTMYQKAKINVGGIPDLVNSYGGALKLVPGEAPVFHYVERKPKGITIEDMLFKAEEILKGLRKLRM